MAVSGTPYIYSKKQAARATPNKRKRWLIPVLLAGQILLKVRLHISKCTAHNGAQLLYMPIMPNNGVSSSPQLPAADGSARPYYGH